VNNIQVVAHTSFLGKTGYNAHSQSFFTHLNKLIPTRVRNYSYTDDLSYMTKEQMDMIIQQKWNDPPYQIGKPFTPNPNDLQVNIVLNESHHYFFYDNYEGPKIAYNVWESTKQLPEYFNRILEYDQFWCPTTWQANCTIEQGYPADRVKVVNEGVNGNIFKPSNNEFEKIALYNNYGIPHDAFTFMIFGRWDYRKSTKEMIEAWMREMGNIDNCYLILSVDNPFSADGMNTTEERLLKYKLEHERIKVLHFPPREEYIKWMKYGSCLLSCSRAEGWNLPLMEALSCGTPSICSDWGGHLEFADGIAYKVPVPDELPPKQVYMLGDNHDLGVWGEPDFDKLSIIIEDIYYKYSEWKDRTVKLSKYLRNYFTWEHAAQQAKQHIMNLVKKKYHYINKELPTIKTRPKVSFVTSFYNAEKYIDDLASSVLSQTLQDWEWIITDDFSSDNTKVKLLQLFEKDNRIKFRTQEFKQEIYWNPHKYATGKYILTIDADDQIVPKTAEVISHFFDENPDISCIHTNANYYYKDFDKNNFKNSSFCRFDKLNTILDKHPVYLKNESGYERVGFMFGAIRAYRNPGRDFNFNDGDFKLGRHEDLVKLIRLEEIGTPLFLNRTLYKVRMHEDSNSGSWGDKGGETEFEKIYEAANKRTSYVYPHDQRYEKAREELYAFLYSDLNEEVSRKKVCCIGFECQKEIQEIYYDHDFVFNRIYSDADYIFANVVSGITDEAIKELKVTPKAKVILFMVNDNWEPGFYEVTDSSDYFKMFNDVKSIVKKHTTFSYGSYLYKYCYVSWVNPERKKVKINLGCGNDIRPGYINVDKYNNTEAVDYNWDMAKLEVEDGSVDEIYTSHVFEHIPINEVYEVLEEWERVLRPGGEIVMRLPNLETEVKIWLDTPDDRKWFEVHRIFGSQSHEGNTHFNGHNPESLKYLIERFNFKVTKLGTGNRGYGDEIQLTAQKIESKRLSPSTYITHFVDGPFAEVKGDSNDKGFYIFDFLDPDNGSSVHQQMMGINTWTRPHRKWFTNWLIRISRNGKIVHEHKFDCKEKNVLISLDSKSLGDTIAWVPKAEQFRQKHECNVYLSTFWNKLFIGSYPGIKFVEPGSRVDGLYASYTIGCWEDNLFKNKEDWRTVPLQHVASNILGLDHNEIVPNISVPIGPRPIKEKYVAISEFSTFQSKFWNYENGWQEIVDHLNGLGYKVMSISKEPTKLQNVIKMNEKPIEETITNIAYCEFFIGLSAGPTWLAWAFKKPTILISGYSTKWAEFENKCERVINESVCHGCFNMTNNNFQRGEWDWCPFQKGTNRQFECSKTITPEMVKKTIYDLGKKYL
jgi:autotransporter strand-loop-strand O-heptosyltransferase